MVLSIEQHVLVSMEIAALQGIKSKSKIVRNTSFIIYYRKINVFHKQGTALQASVSVRNQYFQYKKYKCLARLCVEAISYIKIYVLKLIGEIC